MSQNSYRTNKNKTSSKKKYVFENPFATLQESKLQLILGFFMMTLSFYLAVAFISYLLVGKADQSIISSFETMTVFDAGREAKNWLGVYGVIVSHYFVFHWFGISAFVVPALLFFVGFRITFRYSLIPLPSFIGTSIFLGLWVSLLLGYITHVTVGVTEINFWAGGLGYELARMTDALLGWGTLLLLFFSMMVFAIYFFNIDSIQWKAFVKQKTPNKSLSSEKEADIKNNVATLRSADKQELVHNEVAGTDKKNDNNSIKEPEVVSIPLDIEVEKTSVLSNTSPSADPSFEVTNVTPTENEDKTKKITPKQDDYDPTLDLRGFKFPTLDLLDQYDTKEVQVSQDELTQNKDKIVATLTNFKVGITSIKATIGPTVTLYEIVPEAGVKISRIKNLENDIALSLAALGIRIIAPIPGKGTIGIEVPNKDREMVGIRQVLNTEKFADTQYELPVALGKTISNDSMVIDLSKMPHLLVAGATGQGKSVGLNVILTSLLYKRHPSQLKFVLVDPKKVEMALFDKIERHYLAKIPNSEEVIITNTRKVVHTLNSLCIEMEGRYEMMKAASARNIKEYNAKFVARKLNPHEGHRFLPYIVLVIDELADLMMTAGKEVETPIARLAQLARAIGIHLVVATQRPSVNVITGVIKANFPARLSFRVTSKVDSRTILDVGGAEQLIGHGDMLLSAGSDIIRLQCPFVDTHEVEKICDFIGSQRGYESAYLLPEFEDDNEGIASVDLSERDAMFEEAARLLVNHQQGSASLIQRKLKLGYNRAGRIIDQLEAAGVVGPFEGSKAREVLVQDDVALEQIFDSLKEKHSSI